MLPSRLREHVRRQNWAAVVLDFIIVLVGVLLAFQINSWSQQRMEKAEQRAALERLLSESEESIRYLRRSIDRFQEGNLSRVELLTRLREDNWENFINDEMALGVITIGRAPPAAPPRSAYDEVIASGRFADMGDAELRTAVTEYYSSIDYLNGMSGYIQRLSIREPYWVSQSTTDVFAPDYPYQIRTLINVDEMRTDPEFAEMLVRGHRVQLALTEWWQNALIDAEAMCLALAHISEGECSEVDTP